MQNEFSVRRESVNRVRVSIDRSGVEMIFYPVPGGAELVAGGSGPEGVTRGELRRARKAAAEEFAKELTDGVN